MSSEGKGRIKGSAVREFVSWFERERDRAELVRAVQSLDEKLSMHFDVQRRAFGILPSTWYEADVIHGALDALLRGRSPEEIQELADEGGSATVEAMMKGIYRVIFDWLMTPQRFSRVVQTTFKLSYDSGTVENRILAKTRHQGIIGDWRSHHHFLCKLNVAAKLELYRRMGGKNAYIEKRYCIDDGEEECGSIITWDP